MTLVFLVHIAYKHNASQLIKSINVHPLAIVTAAVDRIEVAISHMDIDRDVRLSGFASYVGKSSMEVTLKIGQVND
jgi:acyl-CoA hydrolase